MHSSIFFLLAFFAVSYSFQSDETTNMELSSNQLEESQEMYGEYSSDMDTLFEDDEIQSEVTEADVAGANEIFVGKIGKCQICREMVKVAKQALRRGAVHKAVDMACSRYAFFIKKICKNLLNREMNKIVDKLKRHYDVNRVCREIHWC